MEKQKLLEKNVYQKMFWRRSRLNVKPTAPSPSNRIMEYLFLQDFMNSDKTCTRWSTSSCKRNPWCCVFDCNSKSKREKARNFPLFTDNKPFHKEIGNIHVKSSIFHQHNLKRQLVCAYIFISL